MTNPTRVPEAMSADKFARNLMDECLTPHSDADDDKAAKMIHQRDAARERELVSLIKKFTKSATYDLSINAMRELATETLKRLGYEQ